MHVPFRLFLRRKLPVCAVAIFLTVLIAIAQARPFTVAVYNLENLFDIDGKSAYDEYQPEHYTAAHLRTKLENAGRVIALMGEGSKGPDIILFQEVELDQTPSASPLDCEVLIGRHEREPLSKLLSDPIPAYARDWPAEAWLLKALKERGLKGYRVIAGEDSASIPNEDGRGRAIKNVIFTRFPVRAVRNYPVPNARNIIEVLMDVDGHPLYVFSNHWKSGAGDPAMERIRMEGARVLRTRLNEILHADPHADIIVGGDFNSQYNQKQRNPKMPETAIGDVLRSQGNELAIRGPQADLYNLWFEVPESERGSDTFKKEWGTLVQLLVSRGLYDCNGVQYVDNSFRVAKYSGLNEASDGMPIRWSLDGPSGAGFSDHFPIYARFVTVSDGAKDRWLELRNPSQGRTPSRVFRVDSPAGDPASSATIPNPGANLRDGSFNGKLILVQGTAIAGKRLGVEFHDDKWEVYVPDAVLRDRLRASWKSGQKLRFYGQLGQYKGRWQFVIEDESWLLGPE
ncbi:MAG: endonuclease/exonuclease/phosphatase family protein [Opitutaceae bacterium]|jgi:hypothetical protein